MAHTTRKVLKASPAIVLMCAAAFAATARAADGPPLLPDYVRLDLTLDCEKPAALGDSFVTFQLPLLVHLGYVPGKPLRQFWFSWPKVAVAPLESLDGLADKALGQAKSRNMKAVEAYRRHLLPLAVHGRHLDVSQLICEAGRVQGTIGYKWRGPGPGCKSGARWVSGSLAVDLTVGDDGAVSGSFTRTVITYLPTRDDEGNKVVVIGDPVTETGTATGRAVGAAELRRRHRIGEGKDVPAFPANVGSRGWPPYDGEIIESVDRARLVWISEDNTALAWRQAQNQFGGGYAPPLLWNNRIYQYYFQPKPGGTEKKSPYLKYQQSVDPDPEIARKTKLSWNVNEAQEVVVCMDAATGATLWKRVMDFEGANNYGLGGSKAGPFQVPCIVGGLSSSPEGTTPRQARIFVQGTVGQLYCLDALTGKTVWEDGTAKFGKAKLFSLQCVDGVLIAAGGRGLTGVDPATGAALWQSRGGGGSRGQGGSVSGVAWERDGKTYYLDDRGLHDPRTGKQLWSFPEGATHKWPIVHGDIAIMAHKNQGPGKVGVASASIARAYRISLEGCEELWAHTREHAYGGYHCPSITEGKVFMRTGAAAKPVVLTVDLNTGTVRDKVSGSHHEGVNFANYVTGWANGLIMGNGSHIGRMLPEAPYVEHFGYFGYVWNNCMHPIYSDGRWFKRSDYGRIVCIDMRKEEE